MTRKNVELKARIGCIDDVRRTAETVATQRLGVEHQTDTYFHCHSGRLKLREINGRPAQLIAYDRPDRHSAKLSSYTLVPVADSGLLKSALASALGVRVVVEKRREIFLFENVRIHVDTVVGLGPFLEFEAVLGAADEAAGYRQVGLLSERFGIHASDLVERSYVDMLECDAQPQPGEHVVRLSRF